MSPIIFDAAHHKLQAIHLFRALLRECTYLPDPVARTQISRQVKHRFQNHISRGQVLIRDAVSSESSERRDEAKSKLEKQIINGHRALGTLQRANNGGYASLTKVLLYAYGRTGIRRRQLLKSLLEADGVTQDAESAFINAEVGAMKKGQTGQSEKAHCDISTVPVHAIFDRPKDVSQDMIHYSISARFGRLKALAESHVKSDIPEDSRLRLKSAVYKMPAKNIWGRSMPRKRVKNLVANWYARLMDRIHPPHCQKWNG